LSLAIPYARESSDNPELNAFSTLRLQIVSIC
jgi:hypothetical protein